MGTDRFLDEARTLARFDHRHINKVHRYFEAHGTAYLVLEYLEGETLSAVLWRQKTLGQAQVERLLSEVLSGLAEVHAAGFVHRDVKPGNLMIQPDGSAVLLDFGAARQAVGQRSKAVTSILTAGYAPIEQYEIKADKMGPWSDIYALGMVAYQCVSGLQETELPDAVSRRMAQDDGEVRLQAAVEVGQGRYDRQFLAAIDWAITVRRDARPQSIEEWRRALPGLTPGPGPADPLTVPADSATSRAALPRWATVVGVGALVLAVGGGAYWWGQQQPPAPVVVPAPAPSPVPQERAGASEPAAPVRPAPPVAPTPVRASESPFTVEPEPAGATVELLSFKEAYRAGMQLPPGDYQVEVQAAGYEPQRIWIAHEENGGPYKVVLAALRQPFTIRPEPAEAQVRILDIPERYQAGMALSAGRYRVEVSASGYETKTETVAHGPAPTERRIALARAGRQPGERFRDCATCPEMIVVPAGSFLMGSPETEAERSDSEGPQHRVTIPAPIAVGVYEVTFAEWEACVSGGGCGGYRPGDEGWGRDRRPVINVSWEDARAYAAWLSRQTGQAYRLLSEAEWEYVARAGTTTAFHFGGTISASQANYDGNYTYGGGRKGQYRERTVAVGRFAPNAFGLYDVHGNVWEWVADCWNESYAGAPRDGQAWTRGGL